MKRNKAAAEHTGAVRRGMEMPGPVRILELINDTTTGGGQVHVLQILRCLDRRRFCVFAAANDKGEMTGDFRKYSDGFFPVKMGKLSGAVSVIRLRRLIRKHRIEIIHTHGGIAGLWGRAAVLRENVQVVHTLHGIHYLHYRSRFLRSLYCGLERLLSCRTRFYICVAESDYRESLRHKLFPEEKARVVRNGIRIPRDEVQTESEDQKNARRVPSICHVGRLDVPKGQVFLIRAVRRVLASYPDALFKIIGDGPLRKKLEETARSLRLEDHVQFLGNRPDAKNLIRQADIFVLPSLWEGLPLTLLEAMAAGKPVVASRIDNIEEVIEDGRDGLLVPPGDDRSLADAIVKLLDNPDIAEKMGREGQRKIVKEFDEKRMIASLEHIYLETGETLASSART